MLIHYRIIQSVTPCNPSQPTAIMRQLLLTNRRAFGQRAGQQPSPKRAPHRVQLRTVCSVSRVRGTVSSKLVHNPLARRVYATAKAVAVASKQPHQMYPKSPRKSDKCFISLLHLVTVPVVWCDDARCIQDMKQQGATTPAHHLCYFCHLT